MRKFADIVNDTNINIDITFRSQTPHYYFGKHIRYYFYFHVIGTGIINICGIVMGVFAFIYPHFHRESPVFTQILQVIIDIL
uniref:Uncharacterized protein n=1 Tax=Panagrolaimus sp. PS1159 TaxID=55785 RepID=A0AC35FA49_9BILA